MAVDAVEEEEFRAGLVKDRVHELIAREVLLVETDGEAVGQVNHVSRSRYGVASATARVSR